MPESFAVTTEHQPLVLSKETARSGLSSRLKSVTAVFFADKLAALVSLDVPNAPQDYELVVYWACGTTGTSFPQGAGIDEAIMVTREDTQCWPSNCDDVIDVYVEVKYIGGGTNQCNKWYLTITSNEGWY